MKCCNCGLRTDAIHRGKAVNDYLSIQAELVTLAEMIPNLEKAARRTPPKHMAAEKAKVEAAKLALVAAKERKVWLESERDRLNTLMDGKPYMGGGPDYIKV